MSNGRSNPLKELVAAMMTAETTPCMLRPALMPKVDGHIWKHDGQNTWTLEFRDRWRMTVYHIGTNEWAWRVSRIGHPKWSIEGAGMEMRHYAQAACWGALEALMQLPPRSEWTTDAT